jgi:alkanesulfonate monooxygenase SsuD/methylene tetrahydromethanopterin reductase-like flavin-dependent oxidoreductase (luciferase family)
MADYWTMTRAMQGKALGEEMKRLEGLGVKGVAVPQVYGPPFVTAAAIAMTDTQLEIASGIAIALTRSPFETATAAIDVDRISDGRFTLGLGVSPKHWCDYFGSEYSKPVSRVRETIQVVRHVERCAAIGKMDSFNGEFSQLQFENYEAFEPPLRKNIPIYVAALRERVCEMAGEHADGVIGHLVWSVDFALNTAREAIARGAKKAGRNPLDIKLQSYVVASINKDRRVAINAAKPFTAFYGGFAQYFSYYDAHGFGNEAKKLAKAVENGISLEEMTKLVPDEMALTFNACGTPDEVKEWIAPLHDEAESIVAVPPSWGSTPQQIATMQQAIEEHLWR